MLLAHGGTGGLIAELAILLVPVVVFGVLAIVNARKRDAAGDTADTEPQA